MSSFSVHLYSKAPQRAQPSGCAERKSTHFELSLFWPAIGWNLAASADQPTAGQNRLSSKRVDFYSAQALGSQCAFFADFGPNPSPFLGNFITQPRVKISS